MNISYGLLYETVLRATMWEYLKSYFHEKGLSMKISCSLLYHVLRALLYHVLRATLLYQRCLKGYYVQIFQGLLYAHFSRAAVWKCLKGCVWKRLSCLKGYYVRMSWGLLYVHSARATLWDILKCPRMPLRHSHTTPLNTFSHDTP